MHHIETNICLLKLGSRSTNYYIDKLNNNYCEHNKQDNKGSLICHEADFNSINALLPNHFDKLIPIISQDIKNIKKLPIKHVLIPNITLHETLDRMEHQLSIIHPIQLSIEYCKHHRISNLVVFGSAYTMTSNYMTYHFKQANITVYPPSDTDVKIIDDYRRKVYFDTDTTQDFQRFQNIVNKYSDEQHVIFACTELSIFYNKLDNDSIVDMALLQIDKTLALLDNDN